MAQLPYWQLAIDAQASPMFGARLGQVGSATLRAQLLPSLTLGNRLRCQAGRGSVSPTDLGGSCVADPQLF